MSATMTSKADLVTDSVDDLTREEQEHPSFKDMSLREKIAYVREVVTVEPLIASYFIAAILCGPALANLEFEKACRADLQESDDVCEKILRSEHDELLEVNYAIQTLIANMHSWQQPMQTAVPLLLVLTLGSYSDRHRRRKPFMILPLVGELFAVVGCILSVLRMQEWSLGVLGILQTVVPSFFGGQPMITMAVFSYIADVSTLEMRLFRVGVVQLVLNICYPVVQSFSGILFYYIGYIYILAIAGALYVFGIIYTIFCIKEANAPVDLEKRWLILDLFNPWHIIYTVGLMFRKVKGNYRLLIFLTLITMFIYSGVIVGEVSVFYLYTQANLKWTPVEYSFFTTVNTIVLLIGIFGGVPLFTTKFHLHDITILLLTFVDKIVTNIIFGLGKTAEAYYTGVVVSIITGITPIALRSIATKIVTENDLGKALSLFGICEGIAPALLIPAYNQLYLFTYDEFPASFFFLGIFLYFDCCVIMIWMYFHDRKKLKYNNNTNGDNSKEEKPVQLDQINITHL